ncbi:uncharacterized protein FIBRA_06878 [Fibroporia radiculosa]|uniref:Rhodanese domain-containing protein n=1 Tax=Fibroporia radiculosa TaxID=599839 RepID=J4HZT0_9APHY|nr:uncharacterized protein FIBRA_06878 [Fibroporia radiculosa]CCM04692.1 predicted protein [Fibroporia radiculosa]
MALVCQASTNCMRNKISWAEVTIKTGQLKLQQASVAVVGAGGLGCPALQYLAAAGVGRIGIIDHDVVEISNLQRQVLHTEARVGMHKVLSAAKAIEQINSRIRVEPVTSALTASNAQTLLADYDIILDCTDNLPTRYLLSDTAVQLNRPLVSGAAQQFDGQLCIYNLGPGQGPCFRCLFPKPPAPEMAGSCEELGILGAVTGVIGTLQAMEAIKLITGLHDGRPTLLMYSALSALPFRNIKLRARRPTCPSCGTEDEKVGKIGETDYVAFCGGQRPDWVARGLVEGHENLRIRAKELKDLLMTGRRVRIIDYEMPFDTEQYAMSTNIPRSDIPLKVFVANPAAHLSTTDETSEKAIGCSTLNNATLELTEDTYLVCRLGNDSQIAVEALKSVGMKGVIKDVIGGLRAWAKEVDEMFPVY